jgi:hypothetical protein
MHLSYDSSTDFELYYVRSVLLIDGTTANFDAELWALATVSGIVRNADGSPIPHALIDLWILGTGNFPRTTADEDGYFRFESVPAGAGWIAASGTVAPSWTHRESLAVPESGEVNRDMIVGSGARIVYTLQNNAEANARSYVFVVKGAYVFEEVDFDLFSDHVYESVISHSPGGRTMHAEYSGFEPGFYTVIAFVLEDSRMVSSAVASFATEIFEVRSGTDVIPLNIEL